MTLDTPKNQRVLVVDDNQSIHDDFRIILEGNNPQTRALEAEGAALFGSTEESSATTAFEVDCAFQGEEALAKLQEALRAGRPYALAFVDVRMPPGWDGVTTIEKLWELCPDLEIVICTAYSDHDWHTIVSRLGISSRLLVLKKPYDNLEVLQLATALTERWNLTYQTRAQHKELECMVAERTANLAATNTELEQFAYVVSHDLKAPLRGIQNLADWISTDYNDKLDAEGVEQLQLLQSRAQRMHDLIDGILQYSRIGRLEGDKTKIALHSLISDVTDLVAPPSHITVTMDSQLPTVEYEETRLIQIFQNLIGNAVKYMDKPEGTVHVGCQDREDQWCFFVRDNGPGIEEKYFERIFQLFQKLSSGDDYESTGLGLTLVKKIVETYGGTVWVESEAGQGSTFWFTLPKSNSDGFRASVALSINS